MSQHTLSSTEGGFYRLTDLVRCPSNKGKQTRLPIGRTTWLDGIKDGKYPAPKKIGSLLVWPKNQIHELEERIAAGELGE